MNGTMKRRTGDLLPRSSGCRRPRPRDPPSPRSVVTPLVTNRVQCRGEKEVTILDLISWSLITGTVTWPVASLRARTIVSRRTAHQAALLEAELEQLKYEATRWRGRAAQLSQQSEAWKAGLAQGRNDVLATVPLLVAMTQQQAGCNCGATQPDPDPSEHVLTTGPSH